MAQALPSNRFGDPIKPHDGDERLIKAAKHVAEKLKAVAQANREYREACSDYGHLKIEIARERGHPWLGFSVWRAVDKGHRKILEKGVVKFKDIGTDDYGNPHIPPGRYYVLTDKQLAKWLDETWQLELI